MEKKTKNIVTTEPDALYMSDEIKDLIDLNNNPVEIIDFKPKVEELVFKKIDSKNLEVDTAVIQSFEINEGNIEIFLELKEGSTLYDDITKGLLTKSNLMMTIYFFNGVEINSKFEVIKMQSHSLSRKERMWLKLSR
jgi:hypothetical protein